jgi:hypothetical protein
MSNRGISAAFESRVYEEAYRYLLEKLEDYLSNNPGELPGNNAAGLIERYCTLPPKRTTITGEDGLYHRLLESLIKRQQMQNVIKVKRLYVIAKELLNDADPHYVVEKFGNDPEGTSLLDTISGRFAALDKADPLHVESYKLYRSRSFWRVFAKGTITGAEFIRGFDSIEAFDGYVASFGEAGGDNGKRLPQHIQRNVHGFGFALACDFLKESGYDFYPKPDVHIKDFLTACGLFEPDGNNDDILAYDAVKSMAKTMGKKAYHVDKLFWLIGSGEFYSQPWQQHPFKIKPEIKTGFIKQLEQLKWSN